MNTNLHKTIGQIILTLASTLALTALTPSTHAQGGVPLWTNRYNMGEAGAVAVDGSGSVFVTGSSYDSSYDYATIKYSGAGVPLWTNRYIGPGNSANEALAVVVDASGNVAVTGSSSGDFATVKYSNAGVPLWTNRYNGLGNGGNAARAVAVDDRGNVFVTGWSIGTTYPDYDYATLAYSSAGVPLWTNRYNGPGNGGDYANAIAVDNNGNVFVTGYSTGSGGGYFEYVTIKYSPTVPPIHLAIERDGSGGLFIRFTGAPDVTYRLQRAASVTGPWSDLATNTAPASGLIEFHEASSQPGQAFYRTLKP